MSDDNVIPIGGSLSLDKRNVALGRVKQAVIELVESCGLENYLNAEEQCQWWEADARISFSILMDVHELKGASVLLETDEAIREVLDFKPAVKH